MKNSSSYVQNCVKLFSKLPGIGPKSASRLAFHILAMRSADVENLTRAILELKERVTICPICSGLSDGGTCSICSDETRDRELLCVVQEPKDILTIEETGEFRGLYHVTKGLISPLDGVGPDDLNIAPLLERCRKGPMREIILALNPTVEGDATALYLAKILRPLGVMVTRIAHGLPVGSDLEFADKATIIKSLEGRRAIE